VLAAIGTEERCGASIFFFCAKEDIHEWAKLYTYNTLSTLWIAFLASGINSEAVGPRKITTGCAVIQAQSTF